MAAKKKATRGTAPEEGRALPEPTRTPEGPPPAAAEGLRKLNEELEQRVARRMAELEAANQQLQAEMAERLRAQQECRRLAALVESSDDAIIGKTSEGVIVSWNAAAERIFGYPAQEAVGRSFFLLVPPDQVDELRRVYERLKQGERVPPFRTRRVRKDGREIMVAVTVSPIQDAAGRVVGLSAIDRDVTEQERMVSSLAESRERLRAIVDTAVDAILTIDGRGVIESVNPAAEKMFGYTAGEMIGQNVGLLMPPPYREEHAGYLANYLQTGVKKIIGIGREVRGRRRDGSTFPADLAVSAIDHLRLFTGILRDITRRKGLEREVLEIPALEQRRIGQELHDGVGQELTGLSLMADALAGRLKDSPAAQELAAKVLAGLERVHQQVRALSRGLVPVEVDPEGLRAALAELAARTSEQSGAACTFDGAGPVQVADAATATHLFRIAQEAVSNALRHGRARHVRITLGAEADTLTLGVRDDGVGVPGPLEESKGLGVRIMRNRAGVIGGTLTIGPAEGGGTLVTCILSRGNRNG
jgi:PAS domain S-box-containing protein